MKRKNAKGPAAILTALTLLALMLAGCGGKGADGNKPGRVDDRYYTLESITEGGMTYDKDELAEMGAEGFIVLEDGGTGFLSMFSDESEITWDDNRIYDKETGETVEYTVSGDTLTVLLERGGSYMFKKSSGPVPKRSEHGDRPDDRPDDGPEESVKLSRAGEITYAGETVVDNGQFMLRIDRIDTSGKNYYLYGIDVTLENRTADTTLIFNAEHAIVDGVEVPAMFYVELEPGKSTAHSFALPIDPILKAGGGDPTKLELYFHISDGGNIWADPLYSGVTTIYPLGAGEARDFVYTPGIEVVIKDTDDFRLVARTLRTSGKWADAEVYFVNKTDRELSFSVDDFSSDGVEVDPYYYLNLAPGASAFSEIFWPTEGIKPFGLGRLEFKLIVRDRADYSNPIFEEKVSCDIGGLELNNPA